MATAAPTAMATAAPTATATTAMTPAQRGGGDTDSDAGGGEYAAVDGCDGEALRAILARLAREREARCSAEDRARRYAGAAQRACEARDARGGKIRHGHFRRERQVSARNEQRREQRRIQIADRRRQR